tara:strand:- start:2160 stop:2996 length:837 start_codon:yes stop_codon:yes gene_type:complete
MGTNPTMTKTPILTIAALSLLVLLSASTSAGEPLELSARITRVDACGGWPSFVTLKDGSILAVRGDRARTSADDGKTWRKSRGFIFGWDHGKRLGCFPCDEPVVIELKDGRILMMCRTTIGQLYRVYSDDGGENWGPPEPSGLASAYAPCMIRRIPTTGDLVIIWNQASHEEIRNGYERNRLSIAISPDDGKTWTRGRTVFRSHLPAVGLLNPGEITGHVAIKKFVGEIPTDFSSADYPNIHFHKDTILLHYDRNLKFGPKRGAYWTLKVFRISDLYE